jgi:hypothetical protein
MMMHFRGGGVGHNTTRRATDHFRNDRDGLDSTAQPPAADFELGPDSSDHKPEEGKENGHAEGVDDEMADNDMADDDNCEEERDFGYADDLVQQEEDEDSEIGEDEDGRGESDDGLGAEDGEGFEGETEVIGYAGL